MSSERIMFVKAKEEDLELIKERYNAQKVEVYLGDGGRLFFIPKLQEEGIQETQLKMQI